MRGKDKSEFWIKQCNQIVMYPMILEDADLSKGQAIYAAFYIGITLAT